MLFNNKIIVFASGNLGFKMLEYLKQISKIEFIATDSKSKEIIEFARQESIEIFIGRPNKVELVEKLINKQSKILLSINYLFILEKEIFYIFDFPINFHGSLLPKYRGRTPHVWAIINNEIETGITAHFIEEGCDVGDIIYQERIKIEKYYTGADLLNIFQIEYPKIIYKVLESISNAKFIRIPQDNNVATYFPKRVPEDGLLNWNWQKDRLYNWIRALSNPYPGAYTYYNKKKVIIDEIKFSNIGFDSSITNGTIISLNENNYPIVKVQNGAIEIIKTRNKHSNFLIKNIFDDEN
jgi:methionyl-tRNA formyltransferase